MRQGHGIAFGFILFAPCFVRLARTLQELERLPMRATTTGRRTVQQGGGAASPNNDMDDNECSVYLAPSSIADSNQRPAGFGVYTTKPLPRGAPIFQRGTGPTVAIPDLIINNNGVTPSWAQEIFMPHCSHFDAEGDAYQCWKSNSNVGSVTNFHPVLINAKPADTDVYRDDILDRKKDPGIGAFSYHQGGDWYATRDVVAGEEIYTDYSERWFFDGQLEDEGGSIPHRKNYFDAAEAIISFVDGDAPCAKEKTLTQKCLDGFRNTVRKRTKQLVSLATADVTTFLGLVEAAKEMFKAQSRAAPTYTFLYNDYPSGGEEVMQLAMQVGRLTLLPGHDVDWIKENGRCLDNIYPSISTLRQAGQGAFASRPIKAGASIVPIPTMIQVTDRETLNIYKWGDNADNSGKRQVRNVGKDPISQQLLTNYCFGDDESSLLLCPASNANLINHCSSRLKGTEGHCDPKRGPNAILRWAVDFDPETSKWLTLTVEEIDERVERGRRGLSLEVVATRDIGQNEEIFLDYGPSWEAAWRKHVASWVPPPTEEKPFVPIAVMNLDVDEYILTEEETRTGNKYPYPDVRVGCFVEGFYHQCQILKRDSLSVPNLSSSHGNEIKRRRSMYKVKINKWGGNNHSFDVGYFWAFGSEKSVEVKVSSTDIRFFSGQYGSDNFLPEAFRHHIGVPHGLWPQQWLNNKRQ